MKKTLYFLLFLLMSCSSAKVITDYDSKTDFSQFTTFDFYDDNGENLNELDVKRITASIHVKLTETGFKQNQNPDFFINFDAKTFEKQNNNSIGIGVGTGGRNGGIGISGGIPIGGKKLEEAITIRFVDAKKKKLFWEGSVTSIIKVKRTPEERVLYFKETVAKILQNYPPKEN